MTANELRIGNLIERISTGEQRTVFPIDIVGEYQCEIAGLPGDYKPIPITEEWLLRFGFYRLNNAWNEPNIKGYCSGFSIWNPPGTDDFSLNDTIMTPKIEYVHQLQNLYYALTNKEL